MDEEFEAVCTKVKNVYIFRIDAIVWVIVPVPQTQDARKHVANVRGQ